MNPLDQTPAEWFYARVREAASGCWEWTIAPSVHGYGVFSDRFNGGKTTFAHRWSYEYMVAEIPDGLHIDHLCRNRICVNPDHLEPVLPLVNWQRGESPSAINSRKTHCKRGHEFTEANTMRRSNGGRRCRECTAIYNAEAWKRHVSDKRTA